MHAVTALLSGIRGAEGGYAQLFERGTTTRATWYETFEGDNADSSGDNIALDEYGSVEVYVSDLVDVVVLDRSGAEVRRFTDGYGSGSVEVRSQSFTGTDYDDASTGAGSNYPTTVQAVLDLWKTKTGAKDWDVLLGSTTYELVDILGALVGLVFNVKSPTYGALGDGVADDTVAINAALTDAAVNGGIVFFPAGAYRITSALTVGAEVSLVGVGPSSSGLVTDHASAGSLVVSGAGAYGFQVMRGISVGASQSNSGVRVAVSGNAKVLCENCYFGGGNTTGNVLTITGASTEVTMLDCELVTDSSNQRLISSTQAKRARFSRCKFTALAATYTPATGMVVAISCDFDRCTWDASACTGGTVDYYETGSSTLDATFADCRFLNGGGATVTAFVLGTYAASSYFEERNSYFGSTVTAYSYTSFDLVTNQITAVVRLLTRERRTYYSSEGSSPLALGAVTQQYGQIVINDTVGNMTVSFSNYRPPHGGRTRVSIWNTSGGAATITLNDPLVGDLATDAAVADDDALVYDYTFHVSSATVYGYAAVADTVPFAF